MPNTPTNFAVQEQAIFHLLNGAVSNKSAARVTWTNNAPNAQHRIERQNQSGDWVLATIASPAASEAIVGKLANGATAHLRIRAEDETGVSSWATLDFGTGELATAQNPPIAPSSLVVANVNGYGATLTWEDQSNNEAYFVIEVRRGASEFREVRVDGMVESHALDLASLYTEQSAPNQFYTVRVKAIGGFANARHLPPYSSAWSNEVTFRTGPPQVRIISPLSLTAEKGSAFSYTIATNTICNAWTADSDPVAPGEQLPTGLVRTGNVINGTITAAIATYQIALTATDGTTSDAKTLTLRIIASSISILPPFTAEAKLGVPFKYQIRASRSGGSGALTYSATHLPSWLTLDVVTGLLSGTPTTSGSFAIQVTATDGVRSGSAVLTITVPALSITSPDAIIAFAGAPFTHIFTATSPTPPVTWELVDPPEWMTLDGATLSGVPPDLRIFEVDVVASLDDLSDSQTLVVTVRPLIELPPEIEGWQGDPLLERLSYNGPCEVEQWYLSGAPAGVEIGALGCSDNVYANTHNVVGITGIPGESGFFDATITAHICCGGVAGLRRANVRFKINGGLFLAWLHSDRTLYDLQFQIRGDVERRQVQSYYQRSGRSESRSSSTIKDSSKPGVEKTTTSESVEPAVEANTLTVKRGDELRLALLIRDGRTVLGPLDGVGNVGIAFRLADSADEEYLFDLPGVATPIGANVYFKAELNVTQELLEELMGDDSVSGASPNAPAIKTLAEIHCTFNGLKVSSATFPVTFVEDVER